MANLTSEEIGEKIRRRESFWVETENERKAVSPASRLLKIAYRTGKDGRGGFYCSPKPSPKIPKGAK